MSQYPTNLTDKQRQVTEIILDPQHRKRKYSRRDIMDAKSPPIGSKICKHLRS